MIEQEYVAVFGFCIWTYACTAHARHCGWEERAVADDGTSPRGLQIAWYWPSKHGFCIQYKNATKTDFQSDFLAFNIKEMSQPFCWFLSKNIQYRIKTVHKVLIVFFIFHISPKALWMTYTPIRCWNWKKENTHLLNCCFYISILNTSQRPSLFETVHPLVCHQ